MLHWHPNVNQHVLTAIKADLKLNNNKSQSKHSRAYVKYDDIAFA